MKSSRYGDPRVVTDNGHGMWTISGKALYYRAGMNEENTQVAYFDPEGGPFISVGDNMGFGTITEIIIEQAPKNQFKVRLQTGD